MYCRAHTAWFEMMRLRAGEHPASNAETKDHPEKRSRKTKSYGGLCDPTFLGFLRWLFLLNKLGRLLWSFNVLPITGHLCYGLNSSWVKEIQDTSVKSLKHILFYKCIFRAAQCDAIKLQLSCKINDLPLNPMDCICTSSNEWYIKIFTP